MRSRLTAACAVSLTALVAALGAAGPAAASAFYIQEQSVKGLGRAYSGEAADTGVDSLWWNPASIAEMQGIENYLGVHAVSVDATLDDRGSTITRPGSAPTSVGGEPAAQKPVLFGVVPNSGFGWRVNDRLAVGFAVTAPFNFTSKYDANSWVRYDALKSRLFSADLQPTVALHLNRYVDVGVGFDAQYVSATLSNALSNLSADLPDGQQRLTGDGWGYGYVAGLQLHPTSRLSVGASYRSKIHHTLKGDVTADPFTGTALGPLALVNSPGRATVTFPWIITLGARYKLTDQLTLNVQGQHVGWSEFDQISVQFTQLGAPATQVTPENYRETTSAAAGLDYDVNPRWTLRGGVQYDPTPTRNTNRSARVPDGNRVLFGLGTTIKPTRKISVDFAASYIMFNDDKVNVTANPYAGTVAAALAAPVSLTGDISGEGLILSGGMHYKF
jgi:long-chain fatty acid transport protein